MNKLILLIAIISFCSSERYNGPRMRFAMIANRLGASESNVVHSLSPAGNGSIINFRPADSEDLYFDSNDQLNQINLIKLDIPKPIDSLAVAGDNNYGNAITAAVKSRRTVEVIPISEIQENHNPQLIEIPSNDLPITVLFKSKSSRVLIQQQHTPARAEQTESTKSEEEPYKVVHEVIRPVIQELREIIQPYRRIVQQIEPVVEQVHTVVAKGDPYRTVTNGRPQPSTDVTNGASVSTGLDYSSSNINQGYSSANQYPVSASGEYFDPKFITNVLKLLPIMGGSPYARLVNSVIGRSGQSAVISQNASIANTSAIVRQNQDLDEKILN